MQRTYSKVEAFLLDKGVAYTAHALIEELDISRGHIYAALSQMDKHNDVRVIKEKVKTSYSKKRVYTYRLEEVTDIPVEPPKIEVPKERFDALFDALIYGNWNELDFKTLEAR